MDNQTPENLVQFLSSFTFEMCSISTPVAAQRVTQDRSDRKRRLSSAEPQNGSATQMPQTGQEQASPQAGHYRPSALSPPPPKRKREPGPSYAVEYSTLSPAVDQETHDYSPRATVSKRKRHLSSSESQYDSPTELPLNQQEQVQPSPQAGHYWPSSVSSPPPPTKKPEHPSQAVEFSTMMGQHYWGRCAHCDGQAVYHEDDWHYPCGRVKELTPHHVISEDMLRPRRTENGELLLEVIPPPPIPLDTNAPWPNTNYATESASRHVPQVPRCTHCGGQAVYEESDWHYPCGRVKELTCHHLISEDMLQPCSTEDGEIIYGIIPPPPRPITNCVMEATYLDEPLSLDSLSAVRALTSTQVPEASQPPKKPKRIINPDTLEIPSGFILFRDQNWFKFQEKLGTKCSQVVADALKENWEAMSAADRYYKYEYPARRARRALRELNPELCPMSPVMNREPHLLTLSQHRRREMEHEMRVEERKKKTKQEKEKEMFEKNMKILMSLDTSSSDEDTSDFTEVE